MWVLWRAWPTRSSTCFRTVGKVVVRIDRTVCVFLPTAPHPLNASHNLRGVRATMAHGSAARASSPSLCALLLLGAIRQAATLQLQLASNGHARAATTTEAATRAGALRLIVTESCAVCHTQGSNPGGADLGLGHIPHAAAHQCTQTGLLLTRARLALDSGASPSVSRPRRASTRTHSSSESQSGTPS